MDPCLVLVIFAQAVHGLTLVSVLARFAPRACEAVQVPTIVKCAQLERYPPSPTVLYVILAQWENGAVTAPLVVYFAMQERTFRTLLPIALDAQQACIATPRLIIALLASLGSGLGWVAANARRVQ